MWRRWRGWRQSVAERKAHAAELTSRASWRSSGPDIGVQSELAHFHRPSTALVNELLQAVFRGEGACDWLGARACVWKGVGAVLPARVGHVGRVPSLTIDEYDGVAVWALLSHFELDHCPESARVVQRGTHHDRGDDVCRVMRANDIDLESSYS